MSVDLGYRCCNQGNERIAMLLESEGEDAAELYRTTGRVDLLVGEV